MKFTEKFVVFIGDTRNDDECIINSSMFQLTPPKKKETVVTSKKLELMDALAAFRKENTSQNCS